ncbi:hypothetical protein GCM10010149_14310 [Nonomuraea roseoviolacea subsp. roseoviolacea]
MPRNPVFPPGGTVDHAGRENEECGRRHDESPRGAEAEIRLTFTGYHGPFRPAASFVAEDVGRAVGASLVTVWQEVPLLAFVFTAPSHAGRGLGRRLVEASMRALGERGHGLLALAVTEDDVRARRLYESLGFAPHQDG